MLALILTIWMYLSIPLAILSTFSLLSYLVPCLLQWLSPAQNFKTKYGDWAVVTGGSSGIGAAITDRLASQNINVVIVALADDLLKTTHERLAAKYPNVQFRVVGINLADPGNKVVSAIESATNDIDVAMLFNNAGYIVPGPFAWLPLEKIESNYAVNASVNIPITHAFLQKMIKTRSPRGDRSLVYFTSSSGGFMAGPMSTIYTATKAWVSMFAASLAAEVIEDQIDVLVINPSPIASNFFSNASGMKILEAVAKTAQPPSVVSDLIFKTAGRFTVVDQGPHSVIVRLLLKVIDVNAITEIMAWVVPTTADYQMFKRRAEEARKKQ